MSEPEFCTRALVHAERDRRRRHLQERINLMSIDNKDYIALKDDIAWLRQRIEHVDNDQVRATLTIAEALLRLRDELVNIRLTLQARDPTMFAVSDKARWRAPNTAEDLEPNG